MTQKEACTYLDPDHPYQSPSGYRPSSKRQSTADPNCLIGIYHQTETSRKVKNETVIFWNPKQEMSFWKIPSTKLRGHASSTVVITV